MEELAMSINNIWVLVAAFLVMFMQPGFAMVEAGFTRSKNTANILTKNLVDFSVGSIIFWLVGYTIMYGESIGGLIGMPEFFFNDNGIGDYTNKTDLIFQTMFAATAATIVSGAVAERTKFNAYIIFTVVITLFIYPISGHWKWGGGWLDQLGFLDFAGSTIVHSVGAWVGLAGAITLGPRLGKYGKDGKAKAIPGHNLTFGALGVFILWFGWFGFNPGSQLGAAGNDNALAISHIALTTNLSAAAGAMAALFFSWFKFKRPTLSLALNGALAGLVAITAGCDIVSPGGAVMIGLIAGVLLVLSVEFFDQVLKIDDPVGAISVHGVCGAFGTLAVGLFATDGGLFYGGGTSLLLAQLIGVAAVFAWAFLTGLILFRVLKATIGLRVSRRIEEEGLDVYEHGESAYN
ncbi:ammonium transporter [Sunxiuqinia elliptica]|uniref:Ammonium transporter n=1 Tax=Sunxiuqinia elliptica TaxID=655355 RepID=A0A1I2FUT7_9BACT|nr:ammonium transporter [Sunxiuqinia elliptica]TDO05315.1 ammonium transporter [Sunxiuqinia elliptica]TDO64864.1 ammonium transporter [Sunxiuqinia elliptica]SFF08537.1 ammonium transporter, Amt family [Sunxiuqinia elliptica]